MPISMGKSIFVCEIAQLQQLIDQVNLTSNFYTPRLTCATQCKACWP